MRNPFKEYKSFSPIMGSNERKRGTVAKVQAIEWNSYLWIATLLYPSLKNKRRGGWKGEKKAPLWPLSGTWAHCRILLSGELEAMFFTPCLVRTINDGVVNCRKNFSSLNHWYDTVNHSPPVGTLAKVPGSFRKVVFAIPVSDGLISDEIFHPLLLSKSFMDG